MIQSLISSAYLHPVLFSRDGQWLTQEPLRLSQLEVGVSILHGCRNLKFTSTIPSMFGLHTIWWRFWSRWTFRRTSIIRILLRLICFPSILHVKGLSSWWISSKIQFCLVCVCFIHTEQNFRHAEWCDAWQAMLIDEKGSSPQAYRTWLLGGDSTIWLFNIAMENHHFL